MDINIERKENQNLLEDEIEILIQYSSKNKDINKLENYIRKFKERKKEIFAKYNNSFIPISKNNIIKIYSVKKSNYCKTLNGEYEIKSKLYEIEEMDEDFIRISKSCIVNIRHIQCFDLSQTGRIIIKFDDNTEEIVSRRKAKDVLFYLDERRI